MLQRTINILTWTPFSYGYNQGSVLIWAICAGHAYCKCVHVHVCTCTSEALRWRGGASDGIGPRQISPSARVCNLSTWGGLVWLCAYVCSGDCLFVLFVCVCTLACVFMCVQVIVRVYACPGDCACVCAARACACVCVIDLPTSSPNNNKP